MQPTNKLPSVIASQRHPFGHAQGRLFPTVGKETVTKRRGFIYAILGNVRMLGVLIEQTSS
jgi:hypothetical protein